MNGCVLVFAEMQLSNKFDAYFVHNELMVYDNLIAVCITQLTHHNDE